jgi:hypothetical protein
MAMGVYLNEAKPTLAPGRSSQLARIDRIVIARTDTVFKFMPQQTPS